MLPLRPNHIGPQACAGSSASSTQPETGRDGKLEELRRTIARMQTPSGKLDAAGDVPLGVADPDRALGGGLACGALHEIAAAAEAHVTAATAFALGVAARAVGTPAPVKGGAVSGGQVVWIAEDMACCENGAPYGPGLDMFGLPPERLLTVAGVRAGDVLWAMEEALQCRAVGVVIGELRGAPHELDLVATRRLSLAAAAHGAAALLLRTTPGVEACAAMTRWVVSSASRRREAAADDAGAVFGRSGHGIGPPHFDLTLTRNRRGPLGAWMLEWSVSDASFVRATHSQPVAGTALDRPHRAHAA
jgi:protein ImuA